jgi:hypothetical protein
VNWVTLPYNSFDAFDAQLRHRMEFSIEAWILPVQGNAVIDAKSPGAIPGDVEAA